MGDIDEDNKVKQWLKRLGVAGFLFFFIKGLLWIAVIYFGVDWLDWW